ncbi:ORC ubiquitin ligase 1 [Genypterus blacodes]|uniref:ORC ubiquitin ligase 1 n=1 Tax=Genypterus blacodes TaxID=154954 RepID=UPI003F77187D
MALNFQSSTLSLTLPISCQICLGKVKQPVICANYHVFCSCCMETWLKKASQCPSCRAPITTESPCREIIGGTNESEHSESPSTRKCLRKTRGELLLREYEEEIEGLIRENEELKTKNQRLESQLQTALDPCTITHNALQEGEKRVDPVALEECTNKLRAATDVCDKVKQDMDKLKEANKALRSQNVDLVQENMRLKAEVVSRSPQKFGRYTVAALEAKILQHEREVERLKKALERSDQYIEDLESRSSNCEKRRPESQGACGNGKAGSTALTDQQKVNMMQRSLSDKERESVCNPQCLTFSGTESLILMASAGVPDHTEFNTSLAVNTKDFDGTSDLLPSTPSSAFSSLTLRSPGVREKKVAFKPLSYLRKLDFEEFPSPGKSDSDTETPFTSLAKFPTESAPSTEVEPSKSAIWGPWQRSDSNQSCSGASKETSVVDEVGESSNLLGDQPGFQTSSEASMDAAYLDKISELDSMMLDGESSSSRGSHLSLATSSPKELDVTIVPQPKSRPADLTSCGAATEGDQQIQPPRNTSSSTPKHKEAPTGPSEDICSGQASGRDYSPNVLRSGRPSQTDELSFDLLFDPLEENKDGPSGSLSPGSEPHDEPSLSSRGTDKPANTPRDRHTLNISQPAKRKSHSPFNTSSPTKLSKLM